MKSSLLWRGILILGVVALAVFLSYPPQEKVNLGLDLQGGMHLVLKVKTEDAVRAETESDLARLLRLAEAEEKITGLKGERTDDEEFTISGAPPEAQEKLVDLSDRALGRFNVGLRGPDRITFRMRADQVAAVRTGAVKQARQTIENRINRYGVAEPVIQEASDHRIVLQLPGVDDPERVRELIKSTAFLEFRITRHPKEGGTGLASREDVLAHFGGRLPDDVEILEQDIKNEAGAVVGTRYFAVDKRQTVTGRDLSSARAGQGSFNEPVVLFNLTPDGSEAFGELTGSHVGEGLAIVLDGKIMSAPNINERIRDSGQIKGSFTQQEVEDLVNVLKSGALPAGLLYLEERTVGPSLGHDSIEAGLKAGLIGSALVVLYMLIIYSLTGVNAIFALSLNLVLLFGGLGAFGATLTLPGIAGIILTIGMAVDANVLIFERIREELRAGRTIKSSIDQGFEKALSAIIDSNVTTLIAAVILFQFGTSAVKGFAVTLTIGLLASMFTAVFVSRWLFDLALSRFQVKKLYI